MKSRIHLSSDCSEHFELHKFGLQKMSITMLADAFDSSIAYRGKCVYTTTWNEFDEGNWTPQLFSSRKEVLKTLESRGSQSEQYIWKCYLSAVEWVNIESS